MSPGWPARPPGFWTVVRLLLAASWRRAAGRRRRQRALFRHRASAASTNWQGAGFAFLVVLTAFLHVAAAYVVVSAVDAGERFEAERHGQVVAGRWFIAQVANSGWARPPLVAGDAAWLDQLCRTEAGRLVHVLGGDEAAVAARLRQSVMASGTARLVRPGRAAPGLGALPAAGGGVAGLLGSLVVLVWGAMLVCQGEGLELDVQRRRHPMWEWLFSHPVRPAAVFLAEMLAPIAANPIYLTAPLFVGALYYPVYGGGLAAAAGALVGVPLAIAASCLGKALEIAITLRFSPRSRGAAIGLMGWLGYATMIAFVVGATTIGKLFAGLAPLAASLAGPLAVFPGAVLGLLLGVRDGGFSFAAGVIACWLASGVIVLAAVRFGVWGAARGLASAPGQAFVTADSGASGRAGFGRNALYRKELLWFARDRSALVQAILIPMSFAGLQLFNMRSLLARSGPSWNTLCSGAIVFGTLFLLTLGPKSLGSEGQALWIALTWPQGLEKLLRAKAWLWAVLASVMAAPVFCYAAIRFPAEAWKIAVVAAAWVLFARSMAAKAVTLATITSESGEVQKVPTGRRLASELGIATFALGTFTGQWNLAVLGVAYSAMTAAAMWQNFRARLPYLYDPWSEKVPPPPTLMHAMVGISVLVEAGAVLTGVLLIFFGRDQIAVVQAVVYTACAAVVSGATLDFLYRRGVRPADIWRWRQALAPDMRRSFWTIFQKSGPRPLAASLVLAAAVGLALGAFAFGYNAAIRHIPGVAERLDQASIQIQSIPNLRLSLLVMAVGVAPFAEEFLFRGLLYRALDREWGGARAVVGSAVFFAVYHPPLAWVPVFLLGATNALLFKKAGRLAPAVMVHMVYNAVVLLA